jgi:hypothetical protein
MSMNPLHRHKDYCQRMGHCPTFWESVRDLWDDFRDWWGEKVLRRKPMTMEDLHERIMEIPPDSFPSFTSKCSQKLEHEWMKKP